MVAVFLDSDHGDEQRRQRLYRGDLFLYSPTPASLAFCAFARDLIVDAFGGRDPESAQHDMRVEDFAAVLAELKPRFIHHDESKRLIRLLLAEHGCDPDDTYFDVPRLRTATSDDYLSTGIAYAFHPHRDSWYSAPLCQVNWWMPVYAIEPDNSMAFHTRYWSEPVPNSSARYDYQEWNAKSRFNAAQQIGKDTREQPRAQAPVDVDNDLRFVTPVGGLIAFSGAQLHSTVPNTTGRTRFSIDFRTVNGADAASLGGAPNIDSYCTGTAMNDYLRMSDLSHIPSEVFERYLPGHPRPARVPAPSLASG